MDTVTLEKLKFGIAQVISNQVDVSSVEFQDTIAGELLIIVRAFVWAETVPIERLEVKYPADWKQAFKERWFPKWLLRKFPVIYTTRGIETKCYYPDFRPAMPDRAWRYTHVKY